MFLWKITHTYRLVDHFEQKSIGIYSSFEKAQQAMDDLKTKEGFKDTPECFTIKKTWRFIKPKLLDNTYWSDGFTTYSYVGNLNKKITCDESLSLMKHFGFLIQEYGFVFDKYALGDMRGTDGRLEFYGPFNLYSFYRKGICINFMNLVQRQDWYMTITQEFSTDQNYIRSEQAIDGIYCNNWSLFASKIKDDIESNNEIFGNKFL